MDFYNCPYVEVIPFRNGNEYDEAYRCALDESGCKYCACEITPEEAEILYAWKEENYDSRRNN